MSNAICLVRPDDRIEGAPTYGMAREEAVSTDRTWAGIAVTEPRMASGWHHHGEYESVIYVLTGGLRMEFGAGGIDALDARPGDFVYVAAQAVHRESNPTDEEARLVVVRSGSGEPVFNVDGPV